VLVQEKVAISVRMKKEFVPVEHPRTDLAPDAKSTTNSCVILHGDPWLVQPGPGHTVVDQCFACCFAQ
jgi:hypothetical protein